MRENNNFTRIKHGDTMTREHKELVTHIFKGNRFADNGLDIDVLSELSCYKELLTETAKALWRRKNPGSKRLPNNFEDTLVLKIYQIQPGSVAIPICREYEKSDQRTFLPDEPDELDEAVDLVTRVIEAAESEKLIPDEFPASLLAKFQDYGKTLRPDEFIEYSLPNSSSRVCYTPIARQILIAHTNEKYEDFIDVTGTVTMARISHPRMALMLDDGSEPEAVFLPQHEEIIIMALKDHATAKIRLKGRGVYVGGKLQRISEISSLTLLPHGEIMIDESTKPIWQVFEEIMRDVPEEEISKLPIDAAENHDYYIYGTPKII
jgi:hypothetical protein